MKQRAAANEKDSVERSERPVRLPDRAQLRAEDAFEEFVKSARASHVFGRDLGWERDAWDIEKFQSTHNAHKIGRGRICFTQHGTNGGTKVAVADMKSFAPPFADFVKALVVHRHVAKAKTAGNHMVLVRACRYLYDALAASGYNPVDLTRHHFDVAIGATIAREKGSSAYRVGVLLGEVSDTIDRHRLTKVEINFRNPLPRPRGHDRNTDEAKSRRNAMLPSEEAFSALYELANRSDLNEKERIVMRFVELLVAGGFRPGEAVALERTERLIVREPAVDERTGMPVIDEHGTPVERVGLRYFPKKGGMPYSKWLPTASVPLALRAVADLMRLCRDARDQAKWLEDHPGQVNFMGDRADDELLTMSEVSSALGLAGASGKGRQWCVGRKIPVVNSVARIGDVRRALAQERYDSPLVARKDAPAIPLSDGLIVLFLNQMHSDKATNYFVVQPLRETHIRDFLVGRKRSPSIFERYGYLDQDGNPIKITPKQFRHWSNTIAQEGGQLSEIEIARWMGRNYMGDNDAYNHMTAVQLTDTVRHAILSGNALGELAKVVVNAPVDQKDEIANTQIGAVHYLGTGKCSHDYSQSPCPYSLSCLSGCGEYWRTKGDAKERNMLLNILDNTQVQLAHARGEVPDGAWGASDWVSHHERIVCGCQKALAVDDATTVPDGTIVQVFPNGPVPESEQ